MSLARPVERLAKVVESKDDTQAAQLELVHEIEQLVRFAPADDVKAAQSALEKSLTTSLLQGPAEPLRHLMSVCFCYIFARGARQTLYTTVGSLLSWLGPKNSPASTVSLSTNQSTSTCISSLLSDKV